VPRVKKLLGSISQLDDEVGACFQKVAAGRIGLDFNGLLSLKNQLSMSLMLPDQAFGRTAGSMDDLIRFDLDGDGELKDEDCCRLVRSRLRKYLELFSPKSNKIDIPYEGLQGKGLKHVEQLGVGAFATVTHVVDAEGARRCLKKVKKATLSPHGLDELKDEYMAMQSMDNPRVAKTYGFFQDVENIYFLNELYTGGDFLDLEKRAVSNGVAVSEKWWQYLFKQPMEGLRYLHLHSLMHCDIKEQNLMLRTADYHHPDVVIIDYGLSREFASDVRRLSGTPGYIPPETFKTNQWCPRGDIFSLGVTMLHMLVGVIPGAGIPPVQPIFSDGGHSVSDYARLVTTAPAPLHLLTRFPSVVSLVASSLKKERARRPTAPLALAHPWFATGTASVKKAKAKRVKGGCC
jgi:serine/threonine protein kinase